LNDSLIKKIEKFCSKLKKEFEKSAAEKIIKELNTKEKIKVPESLYKKIYL